jgi:hypothetical protein
LNSVQHIGIEGAVFMALKIVAGAVFAVGLLLISGGKQTQNPQTHEEWKNRHSLEAVAKRTRAEGKDKVVIDGPIVEYAGQNMSLEEALQYSSVVVARPVQGNSYLDDANHVVTWYRCRIEETFAIRNAQACDTCPSPSDPPSDLLPASEQEFLLLKIGGTATVNGVEVTMRDIDIPKFELQRKYLMFLLLMPNRTAILSGGPTGIFRVREMDDLEPMAKSSRLKSEMQDRFELRLSRFRAYQNP